MQAVSIAAELDQVFVLEEFARTQNDPDHSVTFEVDAPPDVVFRFLTDRVHDYANDATAVEFDHRNSLTPDNLDSGSVRITTMKSNEQLVQRFIHYNPSTSYAYFTDMEASSVDVPLQYSIAYYQLTSIANEKTRLKISVVYKSSSRWLSYFVSRAFNSALENDFEAAVELIETEYR